MEEPKSKAKCGAKTAAAAQEDKITLLPLSELHDFPNHPFKVRDDEAMQETTESIRQYGVLVPAILMFSLPSPYIKTKNYLLCRSTHPIHNRFQHQQNTR